MEVGNDHTTHFKPSIWHYSRLAEIEHFQVAWVYTRVISKYRIQLELETPLGKALIADNSYSIVEINNVT